VGFVAALHRAEGIPNQRVVADCAEKEKRGYGKIP